MKITYDNKTIEFWESNFSDQILISLSGGLDSASIVYLFCKHFPEVEIIPFTARDENAPLDAIAAENIVKWFQSEFPHVNIKNTEIFNFYHSDYGFVSTTKKELSDRYELGTSGIYAVASGRRLSHLGWSIVPRT
jgi:NH3-dependent NAD+ synthetase